MWGSELLPILEGIGLWAQRLVRDVHGVQFHPLPEKRQQLFTGRMALGLDPIREATLHPPSRPPRNRPRNGDRAGVSGRGPSIFENWRARQAGFLSCAPTAHRQATVISPLCGDCAPHHKI